MWPASSQCGNLQQWPGSHLPQTHVFPLKACCSRQKRAKLNKLCTYASSAPDEQQAQLSGVSSKHHHKQQRQQQQQDPRLKWARPEWIKQPQQQTPQHKPAQQAASGSIKSDPPATVYRKQQRLLNKVTYGSFSSSSESDEDDSGRPAQVVQAHQQLFQALAVDFGAQRIGVAVRYCSHNVPLLTLHRQQYHLQQKHSSSSSSSSSDSADSSMVPLKRTAAAILHLALQQGCDGFVIGLPLYLDQQQSSRPSGAAAAAGTADSNGRWINNIIRTFAQLLAELATPLELPVLLVNEQQSSQQARSVMSGAAAYDIKTLAEIAAKQQAGVGLGQQQQQSQSQQRRQQIKQQRAIGRDAYAAALILSRYYNGLVTPLEKVQPDLKSVSNVRSSSIAVGSGDKSKSGNSSISSNSSSWSWSSKRVQQQAATDLRYMQVPPAEQRRRQEQRESMKAAAAAEAAAAAAAAEEEEEAPAAAPMLGDSKLKLQPEC